jgi:hypothetical protein
MLYRIVNSTSHASPEIRTQKSALHDVLVKEPEQEEPTWVMLPGDAADLGRCRRGVEPLRIVIMTQHDRQIAAPAVKPSDGMWTAAHAARRRGLLVLPVDQRCYTSNPAAVLCAPATRPDHRHRSGPSHQSDLFTNPPR